MWVHRKEELYAPRLEPLLDRLAFLAATVLDPADQFVQASFGLHRVIVRNLTHFRLISPERCLSSLHLVAVHPRCSSLGCVRRAVVTQEAGHQHSAVFPSFPGRSAVISSHLRELRGHKSP
jgi:hypothetical protein